MSPIQTIAAPASGDPSALSDRLQAVARRPSEAPLSVARGETAMQIEPGAASGKINADDRRPSADTPPPYRVDIDPDTRRLFTEVLHPRTGAVILRIPAQTVIEPAAPVTATDKAANNAASQVPALETGADRLEGRLL